MDTDGRKQTTWVQCQMCGEIYQIPYEVDIDKLYVMSYCPNCGITKGINLGDKEEDKYYFYNVVLDNKYY